MTLVGLSGKARHKKGSLKPNQDTGTKPKAAVPCLRVSLCLRILKTQAGVGVEVGVRVRRCKDFQVRRLGKRFPPSLPQITRMWGITPYCDNPGPSEFKAWLRRSKGKRYIVSRTPKVMPLTSLGCQWTTHTGQARKAGVLSPDLRLIE